MRGRSAGRSPGPRDWRTRAFARPATALAYRALVGLVGTVVVVLGLVLVPLPGPGWAIVFVGLAVLGSEFRWAGQLSGVVQSHVARAAQWSRSSGWRVRGVVATALLATLVAPFWILLA